MSDEKNKGYFDLSKALDEVRHESFGAKDTTVAGLKLFGKGLFNAARFAVTEVLPAATEQTAKFNERTSKKLLARDDLTDEQRSRYEEVREKSQEYLKAQEEKRREQEALEAEAARERELDEYLQEREAKGRSKPVQPEPAPQACAEAPAAAHSAPVSETDPQRPDHAPASQPGIPVDVPQAAIPHAAASQRAAAAVAASPAPLEDRPPQLSDYLPALEGVHERIHVAPHIPETKLDNARKGRPAFCRSAKALLLADDTVMGGGKDGLLVTEEHISFKAAFCDAQVYDIRSAPNLTPPADFKFHLIPAHAVDAMLGQLRAFLADRRQWHERAAQGGNRDSQFFLSTQYENGDERGPYWLIRAAQAGHATAQHNLGMTLKESDRALAMHWFALAAAQGNQTAATRLADLRRSADTRADVQIPEGATRLIDMMSPQTLRELEQNIGASRQAMRRAMQRIADEERA